MAPINIHLLNGSVVIDAEYRKKTLPVNAQRRTLVKEPREEMKRSYPEPATRVRPRHHVGLASDSRLETLCHRACGMAEHAGGGVSFNLITMHLY
jgi:hypothetical protein